MKSHMTSFLPELNVRIALSVAGYSRRTQLWNCFPLGMRMARVIAAIAVPVLMTGFSVRAQQAAPPAAAASTTPPAPRGIYVWPYNWAVKNGDFAKALAVPGVDGVGVHVQWSEISPALKTYDFNSRLRDCTIWLWNSRSRRARVPRNGCSPRLHWAWASGASISR
jgi:hypothetical protein